MIVLWIFLGILGALALVGAVLVISDMLWYRKHTKN